MSRAITVNENLLQVDVDTPALLLDLDSLERNISIMATFARHKKIGLRPHAKTHKSAEIAKLQMQAGARGICCAKLSEAEVLAEAGLTAILVTSNIVGPRKIDRLYRLYERLPQLMVVADSPEIVAAITARLPAIGRDLCVLVDVDIGFHRSGVVGVEEACELAKQISRTAGLKFGGIQGYAGHVQNIHGYSERSLEARKSAQILRDIVERLGKMDIACPIVTGGGTGTYEIDAQLNIYTELQVGSYVFMDVTYLGIDFSPDAPGQFEPSLYILSQVVSASHRDHVTIDAGSKSMSFDGPMPIVAAPDAGKLEYRLYGDEFGKIGPFQGTRHLRLGDKVLLITPHCDPTVNLHDYYVCVRKAAIIDRWEIQARGSAC
jgi:3-hydroxy-D-aspartate aldolase